MWCSRQIEKIEWIDKVTNEEVLGKVAEERTQLSTMIRRKDIRIEPNLQRECVLNDVVELNSNRIGKKKNAAD